MDATTPTVDLLKTTPPLPSNAAGPQTYEDIIVLIDRTKDTTELAEAKATLNKIHGFIKTRIDKRSKDTARDGGAAVKTAMATQRTYKPYPNATP